MMLDLEHATHVTALVSFKQCLRSQSAAVAIYATTIWALCLPLSQIAVSQGESIRVDRSTLFFASFDAGANPEHAPNVYLVEGSVQLVDDGRRRGGVRAPEGSYLSLPGGATGLTANQGTIECWILTRWPERENRERSVLELDFGEHRLVKLKRDARGRFGFAITRPDGAGSRNVIHLRSEPGALRSGQWHHVTLSWTGKQSEFWVDGQRIAIERNTIFPFRNRGNLRISGSDFDIDEIRLSNIDRNRSISSDATREHLTRPISPVGEQQWMFVEALDGDRLQGPQNLPHGALSWQPKGLLADFDPAGGWPTSRASTISLSVVPGFGARGAFLITAGKDLPQVDIKMTEIVGPAGQAVTLVTKLTRIVRTLERSFWKAPPNELEQVARFLTPWAPRDFAAGEFSEVWLIVEAPANLLPGSYRGKIQLSSGAEQILAIPVELTLRRYALDTGGPKALGIYYFLEDKLFDEDQVLRELADLREHGIRHLLTDLELRHSPAEAGYRANLDMARRGLALIHRAGFRDLVVIQNGLVRVAKALAREPGRAIEEDKFFGRVVDRTMADLSKLAAEFPDLDIYQTYMDEVFASESALDTYIGIATHIRRTSQIPLFITLNTREEKSEALRKRLDPFVDFRGLHGYSVEWWMERGHHLAEMERELAASGDRALFYHNARAPYFTAQRSRIVNGLLLWAWPFESHAPWIYQQYAGNPFDDRDGNRHDFGMAFPGLGGELVSTRLWEATLEGWFDLQHLQTLERLVRESAHTRSETASRARSLLESTRNLIREATPAMLLTPAGTTKNASGGLLIPRPASQRSPEEAPLLTALERELGPRGLDELRAELASLIEELSRPL